MNNILKFATVIASALLMSSAVCGEPPDNAESLAKMIRPILPSSGWKLSEKGDEVILEREEKIGWYNGINLPFFKSERELRDYVKPSVRFEKLTISLRLGKRIDAETFKRMEKSNWDAVDRARIDQKDPEFMPDDKFWAECPKYGYQETPILDTGKNSIYMKCQPDGAILCPTKTVGSDSDGRSFVNFWDKAVGRECQGIVDELGKNFSTYSSFTTPP